jgi:hypothetical protein
MFLSMTELEKFQTAIQPYYDGWKSIDIRSICILAYKKWVNLGTRLILSEESVKSPPQGELLPVFPNFSAFHEVREIKELDSLLSQIEQGILTVTGKEIHIGKIVNNNVVVEPSAFWFYTNRRSSRWPSIDFEFPTIVVGKRGESINNLLHNHAEAIGQEYLDWQLRSLEFPYDGLDDLLISFLEVPKPSWGRVVESSLVEVIAPIRLRLGDGCKLYKGKLDIYVEAVSYEKLDDITIGLIEIGNNSQRRSSHVLTKTDCKKVENRFIMHKKMSVDEAYSVIVFLRFRDNALDMRVIVDPSLLLKNPRILAYSHFDENLNVLKDYLEGKGKGPLKEFEIGVDLLLHFCGFNVGYYGQIKRIQEEIDLVAFVPTSNHIIAVECTTKDLDVNEKLSKFSRRVKELQERLVKFSTIPLIFTALERAKISKSDLKKARAERIGVVAAEEVQRLLEMAGQQRQPNEILVYLQSLLPGLEESFFKGEQ